MLAESEGRWYKKGLKIAIRCSNCEKETMIYVDMLKTTYQDIITTFILNKMLHHVGMLEIIETHEKLQYDMEVKIQNGW